MLTRCPICEAPLRGSEPECACGESLASWQTLDRASHVLRQRGLALAAEGDHLGALVAFLEAALTDPLDGASLVDAGRALAHLGRDADALRLLGHAAARPTHRAAAAVARAVETRLSPPAAG